MFIQEIHSYPDYMESAPSSVLSYKTRKGRKRSKPFFLQDDRNVLISVTVTDFAR